MKPKQMMLFAVAICCGLVAMIGAHQILSGNRAPEQEMVEILVARANIEAGIMLDKNNVGFRQHAKEHLPEGAITRADDWADCAPKIPVTMGMPILKNFLGPKGAAGVTSMIPEGMTVVTLAVDSAMTHSGLLRAGSFVTIACTVDKEGPPGRPKTTMVKTVLKRVKVIAVGDKVAGTEEVKKEPSAGKAENVSFVTYPLQAKLLLLAKAVSNNRIHLTMLPESNKSNDDARDLDEADLAKREKDLTGGEKQNDIENLAKNAQVNTTENERPKGSSFSEYLKQQPVTSSVTDLGKEPSRPTWRITIYKGDKPEIHEVELPKDQASSTKNSPEIGTDWTLPILKFFSGKRPKDVSMQETQSTRNDDDEPEVPREKNASTPLETSRQ